MNLNDFIEQEEFKEEGFRITDDGKADWAMRKIAENQSEVDRIKEFAKQRIEQIKRWEEQELESINNNIGFLEGLLTEYLVESNQKSVKTPSGNVGFRRQQPQWIYNDEQLLKSIEQANLNDLIRIKKEVNKEELKKSVEVLNGKVVNKETGEFIEGVQIVERPDKLNVRLSK